MTVKVQAFRDPLGRVHCVVPMIQDGETWRAETVDGPDDDCDLPDPYEGYHEHAIDGTERDAYDEELDEVGRVSLFEDGA